MRITVVISGLMGGGAERVCVNLANAWMSQGYQVTILTMARNVVTPAYAINSQIKRRDVGWPRFANSQELTPAAIAPVLRGLQQDGCSELLEQITLIVLFRHAILATSPEVIVSHIDLTNLRVLAAMYETGIPVIACEHTDTTRVSIGRWQSARDKLYPHAFAVVASHEVSAKWLAQRGATALAIPNPLAAPNLSGLKRRRERRRLVTLARLSPEKRLDILIQAFARLAPDFPQWDLEIYGVGPSRTFLARLIAELAPGRIRLCGFVDDSYAVLGNADLFASTSRVEGFGNAIWEALACGVPVVAMDCGASVRTLVRHGVDGLIVYTNSELVPSLASLMGNDDMRRAFATRAVEMLNRFSMESSLQAWETLLGCAFAAAMSTEATRPRAMLDTASTA
jgi:GalNAc-alpha-(1->4)-GalNAc-alpha-(1->3)-diNAcBac-PP-undecaprenol alpha-1,4-N-acetyl-D-galactosaminyltransferase